jgi:hypothetical protein
MVYVSIELCEVTNDWTCDGKIGFDQTVFGKVQFRRADLANLEFEKVSAR